MLARSLPSLLGVTLVLTACATPGRSVVPAAPPEPGVAVPRNAAATPAGSRQHKVAAEESQGPDTPAWPATWRRANVIGKAMASSGPALLAVDGDRATEWNPRAFLDASHPEWLALALDAPATRALAVVWHGHPLHYQNYGFGRPRSYAIEASSDTRDGRDGTWQPIASVKDCLVRSRVDVVAAPGARWLRLRFTENWPSGERDPFLREVEVYEQTGDGAPDAWLVIGDSTTSVGLDPAAPAVFAPTVAARHPGHLPILIPGGVGGDESANATERLAVALPTLPAGSVVGLCYGTNDCRRGVTLPQFRERLQAAVTAIRAAGDQPIIATTPWCLNGQIAAFAQVCTDVAQAEGLPPGPDFHAYFKAHPEELQVDLVHPNEGGIASMQRLWGEAADFRYR